VDIIAAWAPEGTRRRGRPKDTWRRVALKRLAAAGMKSWREAAVVAQDRCEWKSAGDDVLKALYKKIRLPSEQGISRDQMRLHTHTTRPGHKRIIWRTVCL